MSNLGMAVELKGIAEGREQASLKHIKNLMDYTNWSAQQAMDALGIPKNEQAHYTSLFDCEK